VGNNPLKYRDPTGHFPLISWSGFVSNINAYKANQRALDIWVGEAHDTPQGNYLVMNLNSEIKFQNFITESATADVNERPSQDPEYINTFYTQEEMQKSYSHLTPKEAQELTNSTINVKILMTPLNSYFIARDYWRDKEEYERMRSMGSFKGSSIILVGASSIILPNISLIIPSGP
jgi:hypothetical protein